jgi:hypothetical protein
VPNTGFVLYRLTTSDAKIINDLREDAAVFNGSAAIAAQPGQRGRTGHQLHRGSSAAEGDMLPAVIVRTWGDGQANLQVLLDGNDAYWATSREEGDGNGQWSRPDAGETDCDEEAAYDGLVSSLSLGAVDDLRRGYHAERARVDLLIGVLGGTVGSLAEAFRSLAGEPAE